MTKKHPSRRCTLYIQIIITLIVCACQEKEFIDTPDLYDLHTLDTDSTIFISPDNIINYTGKVSNSPYSYTAFQTFLENLVSSGKFMFVPLKELNSARSDDKVIISLRHDIDYDINSSIRFARREKELGIRGTYFILHTADYYSRMLVEDTYYKDAERKIIRNDGILEYIRKIQDDYNHEIGWHNDLVTLQVVYNTHSGEYLKKELDWLRSNGIPITGTSSHGSQYCYIYRFLNFFFWKKHGPDLSRFFYNYEYVNIDNRQVKIDKYNLSDFGLTYEAGALSHSRFMADVYKVNSVRWHMKTVDWNSFKPGTKIIILFHPALWDSY